MVNEQLLNYVKQARLSGKNDEQIRQELLNTGWQGNDIDEALRFKPTANKSFTLPVLVLAILGVAVVGYFASAYYLTLWPFEVSVAPVPTFTPRPNSAIKTEDISNLKTYTNIEYGFEVKYPPNYEVKEWAEFIQISTIDGLENPEIQFRKHNTSLNKAIATFQSNLGGKEFGEELIYNKEVKFNNYTAIELEYTSAMGGINPRSIFIQRNNFTLQITFTPFEEHNQILSTFKFIEPGAVKLSAKQCAYDNEYRELDKNVQEALGLMPEIKSYTNQGYTIQQVCSSNGKILMFFDFTDGYWKMAGKVPEEELMKVEGKGLIGIIYESGEVKIYDFSPPSYRLEGPGGSVCSFDKFLDNKILFLCSDGDDSSGRAYWIVYDINKAEFITVKYKLTGHSPDNEGVIEEGVYHLELFKLFTSLE